MKKREAMLRQSRLTYLSKMLHKKPFMYLSKMFVLLAIIAFFTFSLSLVLAQTNTTNSSNSDSQVSNVDKAYQCLEGKVEGKCEDLTLEEQVFSLLALGYDSGIRSECEDGILSKAQTVDDEPQCWPEGRCSIKSTAQSILALDSIKQDTEKAETWLLSQNTTPTNLNWYLQIESNDQTTCTLSYGPVYENAITIGTDKEISGDAGSCLPIDVAGGSYWLRISSDSDCYDRAYTIKCDQSFITTLLYKKQDSSTVYVSQEVNSASSNGETTEQIESVCFGQNGVCNYEGSLWAAAVLDKKGYDISSYMPYLTSNANDNREFLPDAFLYILKDFPDFYAGLLGERSQGLWQVSGDKFYDTALAILSLRVLEISQVTEAQNKLLTLQDADGCWQGNIRNTAFLLYSSWPKKSSSGSDSVDVFCSEVNGFCRSSASCDADGGNELSNYQCSGLNVCCSTQEAIVSCAEKQGIICSSNEFCTGDTYNRVGDLQVGQSCCLAGECKPSPVNELTDCERFNVGGSCETSCISGETETSDSCNDISLKCCASSSSIGCSLDSDCSTGQVCTSGQCIDDSGTNWWLIGLLILLIIAVILAIVFRQKLQLMLMRFKGKKDRGSQNSNPRFGPRPGSLPPRNFSTGQPRPIFPPRPIQRPQPPRPTPSRQSPPRTPQKKDKEYEDVMEKLKKISK